jgi:hypothetical protein
MICLENKGVTFEEFENKEVEQFTHSIIKNIDYEVFIFSQNYIPLLIKHIRLGHISHFIIFYYFKLLLAGIIRIFI